VDSQRIMRVTVRGRFSELSDHALEYLRSNQDEHDVSRAAYTAEGTLTFDSLIDFFSIRYEIRVEARDPDELAAAMPSGRQSSSSERWALDTGG
jgi:hypothetical protein